MEKNIIDPSEAMPMHCSTIPIPFETMIVCWSQFIHESVHIAYILHRYLDISSHLSHASKGEARVTSVQLF